VHQGMSALCVAKADIPLNHQLGICINCGPSPHVANAENALKMLGCIHLLAMAERPNFVALDELRFKVNHPLIMEAVAEFPELRDKAKDRGLSDAREANRAVDAVAFDKAVDDAGTVFNARLVHAVIVVIIIL